MSFSARIGALTDELVQSIANFSLQKNARAVRHAQDVASRSLKNYHHARTNQFEIQSSLEGLDEKFRILDRDDLADALKDRLDELRNLKNKWTPEVLSLLLLLSDKPVENTRLDVLEGYQPPEEPPPLTWAEIIRDDPPTDEELWNNINYSSDSSEDESRLIKEEKAPKMSKNTVTKDEKEDLAHPNSCVVPVETEILSDVETSQFWKVEPREDTGKTEITELQAVRETLFMLGGMQTSLYAIEPQGGNIRPVAHYTFSHAISSTLQSLLFQFADLGRDLYRLRQWSSRKSSFTLIQTFEDSVHKRIADFDSELVIWHQKYLAPTSPISVSLVEVQNEVRKAARPLEQLAMLVRDIEPLLLVNPFAHLEALFDRIELAQLTLEPDIFYFLGTIFFECLQTYLKPIRRWMEFGELGPNDETFFVFENDTNSEVSSLWHDRFVLRRGQQNALRAPKFLRPAAQKIFNSGKSVVFLKELGTSDPGASLESEPSLDFESVCGTRGEVSISPFSELFASAFDVWIKSKYSLASTVLRSKLLTDCGLLRILEVFKHLFLSANGSVFQDFADAIFERMDTHKRGWNDRYLLTELAHAIYGTVLDSDNAEKIVVRATNTKETQSVKGLSSVTVEYLVSALHQCL
jgi:gamma-tubulin complex component 5